MKQLFSHKEPNRPHRKPFEKGKGKIRLSYVLFEHEGKKGVAILALREEFDVNYESLGLRVYVSYTSIFNEFDVNDLDPKSVEMLQVLARAREFAMQNDAILYSY